MNVAGLDLSLSATGVARSAHGVTYCHTVKPKRKGDRRLVEIPAEVHLLVLSAELVVMEDLPHGLRNAAAGPLGMLHGAMRARLMDQGTEYLTVPPATLKCYATGKGNAQKPDLRMELYKRTGLDLPDDNQVDAEWLRLLGLDLLGTPEIELPQSHRRALDKLTYSPEKGGTP